MNDSQEHDQIAGIIFGTAIGDSLGYPVEFLDVRPSRPVVHDLRTKGRGYALFSDDTQMMVATFEGLLRARTRENLDAAAEEIAHEYIAWSRSPENNRAPGASCMSGCASLARGTPWREAGKESGGCGAAMRAMAYGAWHWDNGVDAAWWAGQHALMTHRDPMAQASAAAMAAGVVSAMFGDTPVDVAQNMIAAAANYDKKTASMLTSASAPPKAWTAESVLDKWRGWAGHEAVAASLWCFLQHPDDYAKAVLLAVNSPGDSDSLGAMTGSLVGARLGAQAIPEKWRQRVEKARELKDLAGRVCKAVL